MADRAIDREAHRRDPPTRAPGDPSDEQSLPAGQPRSDQALLSGNMRAPGISEFPVRGTLPEAPVRGPEIQRP
jgi:hypothetical protein